MGKRKKISMSKLGITLRYTVKNTRCEKMATISLLNWSEVLHLKRIMFYKKAIPYFDNSRWGNNLIVLENTLTLLID